MGPHHVQIEGAQVIDTVKTQVGEFVERKDVPVEVKDGTLRMAVGGHRRKDSPHIPWYSNETAVNFIRIRKAPP